MTEHAEGDGETAPEGSPRALVVELRAVHGAADRFAREVFEFRDAVAIPAMNELRYAGRHLLRALADDGSVVDAEQLRKAISHCQRAQYEAAEAGILAALGNIDRFKEDYKSLPIGECVVNYQDIISIQVRIHSPIFIYIVIPAFECVKKSVHFGLKCGSVRFIKDLRGRA